MADYKETLHLPQTDFPMKANWGEREPKFLKQWEEGKLYQKIVEKNKKKAPFLLHDGPPYANGNIHYGTILNKTLKDIVVKYKNMSGHLCHFIPGWDCHGLPIELEVDKELGPKKLKMDPLEIRQACRDYAMKFVNIQRDEFKRLGGIGDWEHPYLTVDTSYEAAIVRELGRFVKKGSLYRGKKPVFWCPSCKTALAEAEVEYADHQSPSITVKFRLKEEEKMRRQWGLNTKEPIFLIIWTTTPWTLPANLGVALHPQFNYVAVRIRGEIWILAEGLLQKFLQTLGSPDCEVAVQFSAKEIEHLHLLHPLLDRDSLIMVGGHVTLEAGTGCVHTAPGHGQEDYVLGQKYGLEVFAPIDAGGKFTQEVGIDWLVGKFVEAANQPIIEHLRQKGTLVGEEKITHSYPHCWRCKKPIVFRATEQWFISMEHGHLRQEVLRAIAQVRWIPEWGSHRITGMIQNRPDWCVSRQRLWGVPIVAVICEGCGLSHTEAAWIEKVAKIFEEGKGSDEWFGLDVAKIVPKGFACPQCGGKKFRKEKDILDVWFDSGVSFAAVMEQREKPDAVADLYLEGSDQHRGWFHTSLLTSVATRGRAPYAEVLTHGFVVDSEGKKFSKSAKNYIPPANVLKQYGAEMLRFWVANEDYRSDIRFSEEILTRLVDSYRKIRNTCRYLLGNLYDFKPGEDELPYEKLLEIDRWVLHRLQEVICKMQRAYDHLEFHLVAQTLIRFCAVELSSLYLDILKDRLYTEAKSGLKRRAAQTVLFQILKTLTPWMAPILSFTAEEVWEKIPSFKSKAPSVFLVDLPKTDPKWEDTALGERWERFFRIREVVTKALEKARGAKFIGNALEAKIILQAASDQEKFLQSFGEDLADLFIVSEVVFGKAKGEWVFETADVVGLKVGVEKAAGKKCARCWKYRADADLCGRCVDACKI